MINALTYEEYEKLKPNTQLWQTMATDILHRHPLPEASLTLFSEGTNIVFAYGKHWVIKIFPPFHHNQFKSDLLVLKHLQGKLAVATPTLEYAGELEGWPYIIMSQLEGMLLETLWETMAYNNKLIILQELGALIREVHALPTQSLEELDCHWEHFISQQIERCVEQHRANGLSESLVQQIPAYLQVSKGLLPQIIKPVLLTGEYTPMNFLVKEIEGIWHIHGLMDFGDAMLGLPQYDLLGPGAFLIQGDKQLLETFLMAYGYLPEQLTTELSHQLTALMLLHQYSNLNVQVKIPSWQSQVRSLKELADLMWGF